MFRFASLLKFPNSISFWFVTDRRQNCPQTPRTFSAGSSPVYSPSRSPLVPVCHSHNNSLLKLIATLRWLCRGTTRSSPRAPHGAAVVKFIIRSAGFSVSIWGIDRKGLKRRGRHCLDLCNNHLCLHGVFFEFTHTLLSQGRALLRLEGASFCCG